jgi:PAS domain S-box-containing protein
MAVAIDISEGRRLEAAWRRSEEKLSLICDNEMMGVALFDAEGHLLDANRHVLRVFGLSSVDEVGDFGLFDNPGATPRVERILRRGRTLRLSQSPFDLDEAREAGLATVHRSGVIYLDAAISPLAVEGTDGSRGYLLQVRDVTERVQSGRAS